MGVRELSAQTTRENLLRAAIQVFSQYGYQGASVDKIAKAASSVDRMIYYYFGSKEGLFTAVIEEIYRQMNEAESRLQLDVADPVHALEEVIDFVLNYYRTHPEFITLLNTENLLQGRHISKAPHAAAYSSPAIGVIENIISNGQKNRLFKPDLNPLQVYLLIVSTGYFLMSNRFTLSAFLGFRVDSDQNSKQWKQFVTEVVLGTLRIE